ncbi:unnamed protein product [Phaeothamnion confervicola]
MLQNKTVLITGGSLGIGQATALECARQGARVVVVSRGKDALLGTLAQLESISAAGHAVHSFDVGKSEDVLKLGRELAGSRVDGLVNCAGIYGPIGPLGELELNDFAETLRVNLLGTVQMCQTLLPLLRAATRGKIVNLSGGGAATPFPNYSAYACSKVAIVRFTENLSLEYPELDVNCVAPGFVLTRLHEATLQAGPGKASPQFYASTQQQIEKGGVPPEKAAHLISWLLSETSDGVTGKFLSAPWDPWEQSDFQAKLRQDKNFATLRRIDDKGFSSIG